MGWWRKRLRWWWWIRRRRRILLLHHNPSCGRYFDYQCGSWRNSSWSLSYMARLRSSSGEPGSISPHSPKGWPKYLRHPPISEPKRSHGSPKKALTPFWQRLIQRPPPGSTKRIRCAFNAPGRFSRRQDVVLRNGRTRRPSHVFRLQMFNLLSSMIDTYPHVARCTFNLAKNKQCPFDVMLTLLWLCF